MQRATQYSSDVIMPRASPSPWRLPQYLAVLALPILAWELWTIVAWLADGPALVTKFRTRDGNWYAARVYEGLAVILAVSVSLYVARGCRQARRLLTFDLMFCLVGPN